MHVKNLPQVVGKQVDGTVPTSVVLTEYRAEIARSQEKLRGRYSAIHKAKSTASTLEADIRAKQKQLANTEDIIKHAKSILEKGKPGTMVRVGGAEFPWEQVNQDALNSVATCTVLRRQIETNQSSLTELQGAYEEGRKAIIDQLEDLRRLEIRLKTEEALMASMEGKAEINKLVGEVRGLACASNGNLSSIGRVWNERMDKVHGEAEFDQLVGPKGLGTSIPWNKELGKVERATTEIDTYFKASKSTSATACKQ